MSPILAYLIIAFLLILGLVGFALPRSWSAKRLPRIGCVSKGFLVLGLFGILSRSTLIIWDGGYLDAEYQIAFQNTDGEPIEGVELCVEDLAGHIYYHYPVTDYLPDRSPTSDSTGLMVFHHTGGGIEFSGRAWLLFCFILVEEEASPIFVCRFLYRGQEVYRVVYRELKSWGRENGHKVEKVERRWKRPDWPASQLLPKGEESLGHYETRTREFFDLDGDGILNNAEWAAYHAGTHSRNEEAAIARLKGEDPEEELEFPVVRRTVTIAPDRR